jgi:hypothetical protein
MSDGNSIRDVRSRRELGFLAIAAVLCGTIPLFWPADVPWINDEPALLASAWNVVHKMEIPTHGLSGSAGLTYGPVPILIYSLALLVTHNLVLLVVLRAFFFMLAIGVAVWWLARMCPMLNPPVGTLALLSPYYWFYSRVLWDNPLLIPFSALTLVTYLSFCQTQRPWKVWLVGLGMVLMLQTHLMCLPLLASILFHFLWQHRSWAVKHIWNCLTMVIIGSITCLPYLVYAAQQRAETHATTADWRIAPWFSPLMGGRFFSAVGLDYFLGGGWQNHGRLPVLLWILTGVSALGLVGFWIGLAEAWRFLMKNRGSPGGKPLEFHLWSVVCLALLLQVILNGVTGRGYHPHYYNGMSFCAFTLVWLAYSRVRNDRWRWSLAGLHAMALLVVLLSIIWRIHQTQGNTNSHYGPTLRTQLEVLQEINSQDLQTGVRLEALPYRYFPHAFSVLQTFYPLHVSTNAPVRHLVIRYADPQAGAGRLVVTDTGQ